jgi:hypothetical protein
MADIDKTAARLAAPRKKPMQEKDMPMNINDNQGNVLIFFGIGLSLETD